MLFRQSVLRLTKKRMKMRTKKKKDPSNGLDLLPFRLLLLRLRSSNQNPKRRLDVDDSMKIESRMSLKARRKKANAAFVSFLLLAGPIFANFLLPQVLGPWGFLLVSVSKFFGENLISENPLRGREDDPCACRLNRGQALPEFLGKAYLEILESSRFQEIQCKLRASRRNLDLSACLEMTIHSSE